MQTSMEKTGNPLTDLIFLVIAWVFAAITLELLPVILSSIASVCVIVNQYIIYKNRKRK